MVEEAEYRLSLDPNSVFLKQNLTRLRGEVRGNHYRGHSNYHIVGQDRKEHKEYFDKESAYRVSSRRYFYDYIGHYSPEKYLKEMEDFRSGKRKSRPNGRLRHKVPEQRITYRYFKD